MMKTSRGSVRRREVFPVAKFDAPKSGWWQVKSPAVVLSLLSFWSLPMWLSSCSEVVSERPITLVRDYVPVPRRDFEPTPTFQRFGYRESPTAAQPSAGPEFDWKVPADWTQLPSERMRTANFRLGPEQVAECYLTVLAGVSGQVPQNVNRWRQQMGAAPLPSGEIVQLPRRDLLGVPALLVEVEGTFGGMSGGESRDDYKLVGLVAEIGRDTFTVKMIGPREVLDDQLPQFMEFAASLQHSRDAVASGSDGAVAQSEPPPEHAKPQPLDLLWDVPESWKTGKKTFMRLATFHPEGREDTECVVFVFEPPAGGEEADNIQRWYGQMGATLPLGGPSAMQEFEVLGEATKLVDATGTYTTMMGEPLPDAAMLAIYVDLKTHKVCVKLTGPEDVIRAERERFLGFCRSMRRS